jgi:hypothetical protein
MSAPYVAAYSAEKGHTAAFGSSDSLSKSAIPDLASILVQASSKMAESPRAAPTGTRSEHQPHEEGRDEGLKARHASRPRPGSPSLRDKGRGSGGSAASLRRARAPTGGVGDAADSAVQEQAQRPALASGTSAAVAGGSARGSPGRIIGKLEAPPAHAVAARTVAADARLAPPQSHGAAEATSGVSVGPAGGGAAPRAAGGQAAATRQAPGLPRAEQDVAQGPGNASVAAPASPGGHSRARRGAREAHPAHGAVELTVPPGAQGGGLADWMAAKLRDGSQSLPR